MFSLSRGVAPPAFTYKSSSYNNNNNNVGVACCLGMSRDGTISAPLCGSLFVPSELSLSQMYNMPPGWGTTPEDDEKYSEDLKQYLSQSALTSKSGECHIFSLLPLSKILLLPAYEYIDKYKSYYDWFPSSSSRRPLPKSLQPSYDGTIGLVSRDRYFILKENKLVFKNFKGVVDAISSVGQFLIHYIEIQGIPREKIQLRSPYPYVFETPRLDSVVCHLSSPFLADIQNKDDMKLVLHRFAITSPYANPWDSILMAIDKSRGYLVYSFAHEGFRHPQECWFVLDSMTNYTTGDLLYFNKDGNFYVLPNAECGGLQVWRFRNHMCSKEYEINAQLFKNNNTYHHIHSYLAESLNGSLLLVRRYVNLQEDCNDESCDNGSFKTHSFEVFKLNFESKQWEFVPSLGDEEALFVGSNGSFSLSSTKYPEVMPNCIYFTDQICHYSANMLHGKDNGIFHLRDCTFTPLLRDKRLRPDDCLVWLRPEDEESYFPYAYLC